MRGALRFPVVAAAALAALAWACLEPARPHLAFKDTVSPRLLRTDPPVGGILDPEGELLITFSERMDPRSLVPGLWLLAGNERLAVGVEIPPEGDIPEAVQQRDEEYTVRMTWAQPLAAGTSFTVVLDTVLIDTEGNPLEGPDGGTGQVRLGYRTP